MREQFSTPLAAADEQAVADFMAALARIQPLAPRLADPEILWIKAQLLRQWDAERKVRAPLELLEPSNRGGVRRCHFVAHLVAPVTVALIGADDDVSVSRGTPLAPPNAIRLKPDEWRQR
jgi:hypothetical protein